MAFGRANPSTLNTTYYLRTLRGNQVVNHFQGTVAGIVKYSYVDKERDILFIMTDKAIHIWRMG
jgi:hypothetical protein